MITTLRTCLVVASALAASAALAQPTRTEIRRHYAYSGPGGLAYRVTEIRYVPTASEYRTVYLVEDSPGARITIVSHRDFMRQVSTDEIRDVDTKDVLVATVKYPYKSANLRDTLVEARRDFDTTTMDVPTTVEINGVGATLLESEWLDERTARDSRSRVRRAASAGFLERLERLRPAAADEPLSRYCTSVLRYILYNESCAGPAASVQDAPGDCEFDAAFGYPCNEGQKARAAEAAKANKADRY